MRGVSFRYIDDTRQASYTVDMQDVIGYMVSVFKWPKLYVCAAAKLTVVSGDLKTGKSVIHSTTGKST